MDEKRWEDWDMQKRNVWIGSRRSVYSKELLVKQAVHWRFETCLVSGKVGRWWWRLTGWQASPPLSKESGGECSWDPREGPHNLMGKLLHMKGSLGIQAAGVVILSLCPQVELFYNFYITLVDWSWEQDRDVVSEYNKNWHVCKQTMQNIQVNICLMG